MRIEDIEALRESWDVEAKFGGGRDGKGAVPESLWETYSAMANGEGGVILLGARERSDGSFDLRGIVDIERVERELWNLLQNQQKVSSNLLRQQDVERIELNDGRSVLVLRVPKAGRSERPVFINGSWERGTFLRVHEGDRRCDPEMARRMISDRVKERDAGTVEECGTHDLNPESVRRYRELFASLRQDHPYLVQEHEEFLITIGAANRSRSDEVVRPTWAGLWMLGAESSIRRIVPHWHLSYRELPDDPTDSRRWLDRLAPDGTWNANLFEFYLRVITKLHDGLKMPFSLVQGQYRLDETPVHGAVREALVNSLIHADYQGTTGVRVLKRRSSFEFINPGLLLVSAEQVWRGGVSEPRNPVLQRLFGLLRLGEREGTGGPTMRKVWREQHWRAPGLVEDAEHSETHLQLPFESLLPDSAVNILIDRWGARFTGQDELGRVILVVAEAEGGVNHARIVEVSEAHPRDISSKFQELVRGGLLEATGKTRNVRYTSRIYGQELTQLVASNLPHKEINSPHKEINSPHKEINSPHKENEQGQMLERVRLSKRASLQMVELAILEYCTSDYRTSQQIAGAIKRSLKSVADRYLPPMVDRGALEMRYPGTPSHPGQAYRTRN